MALIDIVLPYIRDNSSSTEEIQSIIDSAVAYLTNAGVTEDETNPLYILAVKMLTVHWNENREPIGSTSKIAFGLEGIITQLQNI